MGDEHGTRILAVGKDISLLSSGANVLTQAGYIADIVLNVEQAVRRALVRQYDLAIVSSTFTRDDQLTVRACLKQVRPSIRVLLLGSEHDSPDAFLTAVAERLRQKKKFQFGTKIDGLPIDRSIK